MAFVNPIGRGLKPGRVDMGVDYTGHGSLYAMGSGVITNVKNAGWPGGTFIGLHLDSGQYMYYAENIIPHVHTGQRVQAGDIVGTAIGTYPYTEIGWAAPPGTGETMAAKAGQAAKGSDPGEFPTGYGVNMSDLIKSLGGPGGIVSGPVTGGVPANWGVQPAQTTGLSAMPGCVPFIWIIWLAWQTIAVGVKKCLAVNIRVHNVERVTPRGNGKSRFGKRRKEKRSGVNDDYSGRS